MAACAVLLAAALGVSLSWYAGKLHRFGLHSLYGTKIFYDQFHVRRHFIDGENERGQWKYHIVSGYHDFRELLENEGYDVHVHREGRITPGMLDGYDIFFIGEQTAQGTLMNKAERNVIHDFVRNGGGMWSTVEHTNAHDMGKIYNRFMRGTGVQARYDSICEYNGTMESRDWVPLRNLKTHPITEGLREIYFFNGCSMETEHGIAFSSDSSWSDAWNPADPPVRNGNNIRDPGEPAGPLPGLAAFAYGKGRIATTCDHNAFSNPSLHMGSHAQLLRNAMAWLGGGTRLNRSIYFIGMVLLGAGVLLLVIVRRRLLPVWIYVAGLGVGVIGGVGAMAAHGALTRHWNVLFAEVNQPSHSARNKELDGVWGMFQHAMKSGSVRLWMKERIAPGYDALVLLAPREALSPSQLEQIDAYLREGKTVIYLASAASLQGQAGQQLMEQFGFRVSISRAWISGSGIGTFRLEGDGRIHRGTDSVSVARGMPLARISGAGWRVAQSAVSEDGSITDIVAIRNVGGGRVIVAAPLELFTKRAQRMYKEPLVFVDLVVNLFEWMEDQSR
jgi:hypothetical protein